MFTWQTLKDNFIKYFSFQLENEELKPTAQQIQQFLNLVLTPNEDEKLANQKPMKDCQHITSDEANRVNRLQLEIYNFSFKIFAWKKDHPLVKTQVKTLSNLNQKQTRKGQSGI